MLVKLDENLPVRIAHFLADLGHQVDTVRDEGLAGRADSDVWSAVQGAGRFLMPQDLDFSDARRFAPGTHHGVLVLRLAVPGRLALAERVRLIFETEDVATWAGCFVIASDRKIRVRRPGNEPDPAIHTGERGTPQ